MSWKEALRCLTWLCPNTMSQQIQEKLLQFNRSTSRTWCAARCEQRNSNDTGLDSVALLSICPSLLRVSPVWLPTLINQGVWPLPLRSSLSVSTRRRSANAITCEDGPVGLDLNAYTCRCRCESYMSVKPTTSQRRLAGMAVLQPNMKVALNCDHTKRLEGRTCKKRGVADALELPLPPTHAPTHVCARV
jgi:hypothetical protein